MHTPEFDFEALVRSMGMADIQSAVNAAAKKVAEEQEAARRAAEEAERKRREAERAAAAAIAAEKKREEEASRARESAIKRITAIANAALSDSLTADDIAYLLRQYARIQHPDFPAEDFAAIFDADTIENYVDMTTAVFNSMKFLLPSSANALGKGGVGQRAEVPGVLNFDEAFKQLFPNHNESTAPKQDAPKTDDEVLRSFVNRILK
jgi:hypothetical protein